MTIGAVSFLAGLTVAIFFYAIFTPAKKVNARRKASIDLFSDQEDTSSEELKSFDKYVRPTLRNFLPQAPLVHTMRDETRSRIENLLLQSDNPFKLTPEEYVGLQFLSAAFGIPIGVIVGLMSPTEFFNIYMAVPLFAVMMFFIPHIIHTSRRDSKTNKIQKELPEALDLLVVTINAGNTFVPAMSKVADRLPEENTMRREFKKVVAEINTGVTKETALQNLSYRTASDDIAAFVGAFLQSDKTGADPTESLQAQAQLARQSYEARLEQKTAKLNTLMFIPLIPTMLPALLIIFLAPSLMQLGSVL